MVQAAIILPINDVISMQFLHICQMNFVESGYRYSPYKLVVIQTMGETMTITEAIIEVLKDKADGCTAEEIYDRIIEKNLYSFGAKSPISVIKIEIRRQCSGIDFPTAYNRKLFRLVKNEDKKNYYALLQGSDIPSSSSDGISTDLLPEERIVSDYEEHLQLMKMQLIEKILENDPAFFEKMVVDLLVKMGYGYDKDSGIVTGRPHDGGIDGVIKEDKLGLDSIYIQAKRYKLSNTVKAPEIQQFIGAMGKVNKGVFITTSSFTKGAVKIAQDAVKTISLIDGDSLADLMITHKAGVTVKKSIMLYQLDEDYFL